jgi:hypothetical protein
MRPFKLLVIVGGSIFELPLRKFFASDFVRAYVQRPIFARQSDESNKKVNAAVLTKS